MMGLIVFVLMTTHQNAVMIMMGWFVMIKVAITNPSVIMLYRPVNKK
jgi:hypothetical protein